MEKWRLYLIFAGMLLVAYNISNVNFDNLEENTSAIVGVISSLLFTILLISTRKK